MCYLCCRDTYLRQKPSPFRFSVLCALSQAGRAGVLSFLDKIPNDSLCTNPKCPQKARALK